jgi:SAM-dependent methyltransferase
MNFKSLTLKNLNRIQKIYWDRFNGLDFLTNIEPEEVGLNSKEAHKSSPSGNKYLEKVLTDLNISSQDSIIDIGCGKGSAMRTMLKFPFAQVHGIELSERIATIATRNFKRLNSNRSRIFLGNACTFKEYESYNFIYFYNPFPENVMVPVIIALIESIRTFERELIIIYNNATCHDAVVKENIFIKTGTYPDEWGNGIHIYSNKGFKSTRLPANKF